MRFILLCLVMLAGCAAPLTPSTSERITYTPTPTPSPEPLPLPRKQPTVSALNVQAEAGSAGGEEGWPGPSNYPGYGWPWQAVADCESGDRRGKTIIPLTARWDLEVGRYSGGLQFLPSTWVSAGGQVYAPRASQATPEQQIEIAQSWLEKTSWAQWPACSRMLGLR